ncbi:MAG: SpaA isopeptide-forming pilin-related protein [Christensenellales bacterium]|jgi:uncharacterized surface anchored protein
MKKKLNHVSRRMLAMLLCVLSLLALIPSTAFTASQVQVESRNVTNYFEYISGSGTWEELKTPEHYIVGTNEMAYCLQHKKSSPHVGNNFNKVELSDFYSSRVVTGLQIILERGYPAETPSNLTAVQARYATANAIRFWLSENGDADQYNFTNRQSNPGSIRAESGQQAVLDYADQLLAYARSQQRLEHRVAFSPASLSMALSGDYFVGTTTVSLTNCNGGYTLDQSSLPSGSQVSGYTCRNGDVLTIRIPAEYGNRSITLQANGLDDRVAANIFMYASTSSSIQNVITIGMGSYRAAGEGSILLNTPAYGSIDIVKTTKNNGGSVSGFQFRVTKQDGTLIGTYVSGSNGKINVPNLLAGWYKVEEINLSDEFVKPSPNPVDIEVKSGQTATASFDNVKKMGVITVQKSNPNPVMGNYSLAGAEFTVKDAGGAVVNTIVTGANGKGQSKALPLGSYSVFESKAPWGFVVAKTVHSRTLTGAQSTAAIIYAPEIGMPEKPQVGRIKITKQDAETGSAAQGDATLSGAVFDLFDSKGNLVERLYCGDNTTVTSKDVPLGKGYVVKEVTPPKGYTLSGKEYTVNIDYAGQDVEVTLASTEVKNTVIKGRIQIVKHSDDPDPQVDPENEQVQAPLAGVVFDVYLKAAGSYDNAKPTERDRITTDEHGYARTKDLPYGLYVVKEVQGVDEHKVCDPFDAFISDNDRTYYFIIENLAYFGKVKIIKVDEETGKTIPQANIEFKVKNTDTGEWVSQEILYPTPVTIDTYLTNTEGWLVMPSPLKHGNYELHEVQSPYGYLLSEKAIPFKVTSDDPQEFLEVKMPDKPAMGRVSIEKTGEMLAGADEIEGKVMNIYVPRYEMRSLPDAVFDIIARTDIVTPDGTVRVKAGTVVDTLTTDENGKAESKLLYLGDYYAVEREASFGMTLDETEHDFSLVYEDQNTPVVISQVGVFDERQKAGVTLKKHCEFPENAAEDFNPYASIVFGLFAREDILTASGEVGIPKNGLLEYVTPDRDGKGAVQTNLPFGSYYFKELQTGAGYLLDDAEYDIAFEYAGQDVATVEIAVNDGKAIENRLQRGSLKLIKTFEGKETPIKGVPFTIVGPTSVGTAVTINAVTDENGAIVLDNLLVGYYTIKELDSELTAGNVLSNEVTIHVAHNAVADLTIHNKLMHGDLKIIKVFEGKEKPIAGVKFTTTGKTLTGKEYSAEFATDENGCITVEGLLVGDYTVKEIGSELTVGYVLSKEQTATIAHERLTEMKIENKLIRGDVKLTKIDKEGGTKLAGAVFDLYGMDGKQMGVYVTDKNGELLIKDLPYGTGYRLIESKAPEGYKLDKVEFTFDIKENGATLEYAAVNEKLPTPTNPKTGDDRNPALWAILLGLSAAGGVVMVILALRKKTDFNAKRNGD